MQTIIAIHSANDIKDNVIMRTSDHDPLVYFARAMDGLPKQGIIKLARTVRAELAREHLEMVDPFVEPGGGTQEDITGRIVRWDLSLLRKSDGVLMDMSIPMRNYVGCTCELVYAFSWGIPVAVYVGESSNESRHWLRYHASAICRDRSEAINKLSTLLR